MRYGIWYAYCGRERATLRLSFKLTSRVGFEDSPYKTTAGPRLTSLLEQTPKMMPSRCSDGPARKRARALQDDDDAANDAQDDAPTCEVCGRHPRKYCCPRCACVTCSLACCAAHKRATGCDGRRDAAAHRPLKAMGLRELRADCAFLEAAARSRATAERARRAAPHLGGRERRGRSGEAPAAARLRRAAERRRIRLLLMPDGMVTTRADDGDGENARTALFLARRPNADAMVATTTPRATRSGGASSGASTARRSSTSAPTSGRPSGSFWPPTRPPPGADRRSRATCKTRRPSHSSSSGRPVRPTTRATIGSIPA